MKIHNIGIVGYGGFGQFLKNSWQELDNVRIIAVADEIESRNPGGDIKFYNQWKDLLTDKQVDIVSVVTPPQSHAAIACAAMENGKSVLIEKPMATEIQDAKRVIEVRDRTGSVATVNYMLRFNPIVEVLAKLTKEGVFGKLRHVNVENYAQDEGLPIDHWFWNPEVSGGILIEHAVHFIDLIHSMTEQRHVSVTGFCHKRNTRQEDQVLACAHYDGGLIATHYHAFARPGFFENTSLRLCYDLAQIDLEGWIPLTGKISAIVNHQTKDVMTKLPGFRICSEHAIEAMKDFSRPEGWGQTHSTSKTSRKICSGGIEYDAEELIDGRFNIEKDKQEVYSDCVRAMLLDLICKVDNPRHHMRVELEDGLASLEIAQLATEFGRSTD